jgi:hypothetical protein
MANDMPSVDYVLRVTDGMSEEMFELYIYPAKHKCKIYDGT